MFAAFARAPRTTRPRRIAALAWALVAGAAAAGPGDARSGAAPVHLGRWSPLDAAVVPDARVTALVERLLAAMTTEEKVGQLLQADITSATPDDVRRFRLGAVLAGGSSAPDDDLRSSPARWLALTDAYFRASIAAAPAGHAAIPVLFGVDAVHGHAHVRGATVFPHNIGLGATQDAPLIEAIGRATAAEVAATGIDWTFAPTVAVVRDVRWGRAYESYSEDPGEVARDARALVTGLQGRPGSPDFLGPERTLATLKHFLGDGGTLAGRDQFDDPADEPTLRAVHAPAYRAALDAGALVVMASYSSWRGVKMHANRNLLTGVLKQRWAFPGFVVGDWNAQEQVPGCTKFDCARMFAAGIDMAMAPDSWRELRAHLLREVRSGALPRARLDDAVRRILRVKALAGSFGKRPPTERGLDPDAALGNPAHRALARRAVRESLVLLKNDRRVLPLDPRSRILVAGAAADDIGRQCGGWTLDWQGDHNSSADFPGATSIFAGIRAAVEAAGGSALLSRDGSFTEPPAAAVVVFGEAPYAEYQGDRETLLYSDEDHETLALLRRLQAAGIPVVSVFLSGRPLWVNPELNASDAFVAAWLPGSEGAGIADLLFRPPPGEAVRDFSGRLGFSWPATALPVGFLPSGTVSGALFPRGFGLSYGTPLELGVLSEDPRLPPSLRARDTLFHAGHVTAPWSVYVGDRIAGVRLTLAAQTSPARVVTARIAQDGLRARWSGLGRGELRIGGRAADFRGLARDGGAIVVRYRLLARPTQAVRAGVSCQAPYGTSADDLASTPWSRCAVPSGAMLDLTGSFRAAPVGHWRTFSIPLRCLAQRGADLAEVDSPLVLTTAGSFAVEIAEARIEPSFGDPAHGERCPPAAGKGDP